MNSDVVEAVVLTLRLGAISTLVLLIIGLPLAWWLARLESRIKPLLEAVVALPLVLPPVVLGFYLLIAFSPQGPLGSLWMRLTGEPLAFTFFGLIVGSVIYSLPFVIQPIQKAFEGLDTGLLEAARLMGAGPLDRFFTVVLPLSLPQIITAACLGFAHTLGEFGVVLMIGGNIPGETRVISLALFDAVEVQQFDVAHQLAGGLLVFSLLLLAFVYNLNRRFRW